MNQLFHTFSLEPSASRCPLPEPLQQGLQHLFGDRLSLTQATRDHHGRDESPYGLMAPDAVVFAHSTDEVAHAVALCAAHAFPVIAYGTGTSLEGHVLAVQGGVT